MFHAAANRKHSYLHKWLKCKEPGVTNAYMDQVMRMSDLEEPIQPLLKTLASMQPQSYGLVMDQTKGQLAYGHWGVPQLIHQLASKNHFVRYQSLGTLIDEMIDPEKCCRAFGKLSIVNQLTKVLQQEFENNDEEGEEENKIVYRTLIVLQTIACHENGAEKILVQANLVKVMNFIIEQKMCTEEVAKIFSNMANNYYIADMMIAANFFNFVRLALIHNPDVYDFYSTLACLAERNPEMAVKHGFFEFLNPKISLSNACSPIIMKCFALIIQCDIGQKMCDEVQVIPRLLAILNDYEELEPDQTLDWRQPTMTLEFAAMAMHNCLISTRSRWLCQEFWDMPIILVRHAHCKTNSRLQVHCLQTLRHITENPSIKRFVGTVCKSRIKRIYCPTEGVRTAKVELLNWLRFRNFHCDDPTTADVLL